MLNIILILIAIFLAINFATNLCARITEGKYWRQMGLDLTDYSFLRIGYTQLNTICFFIIFSIIFFWGHIIRLEFLYFARFK